jgi:hypothetical protein
LQGDSRQLQAVIEAAEIACCVSSPPYANLTPKGGDQAADPSLQWAQGARTDRGVINRANYKGEGYGFAPGQLAALPPGRVEAVVSSPPWEDQEPSHAQGDPRAFGTGGQTYKDSTYGTSPGQLGNAQGTTFWSAAREILAQVYAVLKPGGHAIWVVKAYCRAGKIVDFPGQWRALCEHVGFVTLHEHHALLVEHHGTQGGLFGEDTQHTTAKKSFFRRLHEAKRPDLAIDYEVVVCMSKPASTTVGAGGGGVTACVSSPPYAATALTGGPTTGGGRDIRREHDASTPTAPRPASSARCPLARPQPPQETPMSDDVWTPEQYHAYLEGRAVRPTLLMPLAADAPEDLLRSRTQALCKATDHLYYHARKSQGSTPGWPDAAICHRDGGPLYLWEWKRATEQPSGDQQRWLAALARVTSVEVAVYTPAHWPLIQQFLTRR